ncbi:hypothetical protein [Streptomyces sp. NBC_01477]|uniref:hypothetical protein n=1 Tax=Streptomyces sp. NBC_01477 TaxID=2976015 RepID=UPI002E310239|nr:hypothetical protein [Streptomyces sp. NBC_01477]
MPAPRKPPAGHPGGISWSDVPAPLPELDVRLLWHARLDADPAQRRPRETVRGALG